jgi:hypothetical protein
VPLEHPQSSPAGRAGLWFTAGSQPHVAAFPGSTSRCTVRAWVTRKRKVTCSSGSMRPGPARGGELRTTAARCRDRALPPARRRRCAVRPPVPRDRPRRPRGRPARHPSAYRIGERCVEHRPVPAFAGPGPGCMPGVEAAPPLAGHHPPRIAGGCRGAAGQQVVGLARDTITTDRAAAAAGQAQQAPADRSSAPLITCWPPQHRGARAGAGAPAGASSAASTAAQPRPPS